MAIDFTKESGRCCIVLSDVVDISHAAELKRILVQALQSNAPLCIQISGATAIDVTIVQLLWAAVHSASAAGTQLKFEGTWSEDVERLFAHTGLAPILESLRVQSLPGGVDVLTVRH